MASMLAMLYREYEGRVLRKESFVFLNVMRLAKLLKPLFNHKWEEDNGDIIVDMDGERPRVLSTKEQKTSWKRLREDGILDIGLARVFWPNGRLDVALPIVKKMDLAFPLGKDDSEFVVMQHLPPFRPDEVDEDLNGFRNNNYPILEGAWRISRGAPPGMIESLLTRCCALGDMKTFWRVGVLVRGNLDGSFALILEFVDNETLKLHVYGNTDTVGPWMALSFAMSVTLSKMMEFPGIKREAKLQCPTHSGRSLWMSDQVITALVSEDIE